MSTNNFFNANRDEVTIYKTDGTPHVCTRLNARELVAGQGFRWKPTVTDTAPAPEVVVEAPAVVPETAPEPKAAEPIINHNVEPLKDVALAVSGSDDVRKYLDGFTTEDLKTMTEERYGEKVHPRIGKDKLIDKMVELESVKLTGELDKYEE